MLSGCHWTGLYLSIFNLTTYYCRKEVLSENTHACFLAFEELPGGGATELVSAALEGRVQSAEGRWKYKERLSIKQKESFPTASSSNQRIACFLKKWAPSTAKYSSRAGYKPTKDTTHSHPPPPASGAVGAGSGPDHCFCLFQRLALRFLKNWVYFLSYVGGMLALSAP